MSQHQFGSRLPQRLVHPTHGIPPSPVMSGYLKRGEGEVVGWRGIGDFFVRGVGGRGILGGAHTDDFWQTWVRARLAWSRTALWESGLKPLLSLYHHPRSVQTLPPNLLFAFALSIWKQFLSHVSCNRLFRNANDPVPKRSDVLSENRESWRGMVWRWVSRMLHDHYEVWFPQPPSYSINPSYTTSIFPQCQTSTSNHHIAPVLSQCLYWNASKYISCRKVHELYLIA